MEDKKKTEKEKMTEKIQSKENWGTPRSNQIDKSSRLRTARTVVEGEGETGLAPSARLKEDRALAAATFMESTLWDMGARCSFGMVRFVIIIVFLLQYPM